MCVIKRRAVFKEMLSMTASASKCLWWRILENSPKLSKILAMIKYCKEMSEIKHCLKEVVALKYFSINDQYLILAKELIF